MVSRGHRETTNDNLSVIHVGAELLGKQHGGALGNYEIAFRDVRNNRIGLQDEAVARTAKDADLQALVPAIALLHVNQGTTLVVEECFLGNRYHALAGACLDIGFDEQSRTP